MCEHHFFATPEFDRAVHRRRDPDWVCARLADSSTLLVPVWRDRSLVDGADPPGPVLITVDEAGELLHDDRTLILLGISDETAYFALDLSELDRSEVVERLPAVARLVGLRRFGAMLEARDGGLLAYARAMVWWHRHHSRCGVCGAPTRVEDAGHLRRCSRDECGTEQFPRTDPAIIVRVTREGRCLLGRQPSWPAGRYSVLAGFVEPGESLEQAVRREVLEETGIEVDEVHYHSSQPWPFPASLMIGFTAEARSDEIDTVEDELEEALWFDRGTIEVALERREVRLPPRFSISRRLIDDWRAGDGPAA